MSTSWLRPTTVLRGRIESLFHGKAHVSFEMEGRSVEFPERGAASPVQDGQVVTLVVRQKFLSSTDHVALAFAEESEWKARSVGRGIHILGVLFGLTVLAAVTVLRVLHGPSHYRGGEAGLWMTMIVGGMVVPYSAYRAIEISRAVKLLREHLQNSPRSGTGV